MKSEYITVLTSLRKEITSDFSALAFFDPRKRQIFWAYASGNENERYKKMFKKPGVGLTGNVIRIGETIVLDMNVPDLHRLRQDSPIMLTENLQSAVAAPVFVDNVIVAVLLVGSRTLRSYTQDDVFIIKEHTKKITALIKKQNTSFSL